MGWVGAGSPLTHIPTYAPTYTQTMICVCGMNKDVLIFPVDPLLSRLAYGSECSWTYTYRMSVCSRVPYRTGCVCVCVYMYVSVDYNDVGVGVGVGVGV